MKLPFLDRTQEQRRLQRFLASPAGGLAVVYGRRRCGKSTLVQRVCPERAVYFLADQREAPLQIRAFAEEASWLVPQFAAGTYPSWDALLAALDARVEAPLPVMIDEFPYLVAASPELPSLLQRYLDRPGPKKLGFLLCGSSQRMMQGLVLDRTAPLYGRAQEILKVEPLRPGWLPAALGVQGAAAVEAFAVWGGVPRYWELAHGYDALADAVQDLVLERQGVLHDEPAGLLLDELRTAGQAYSLLSLIGNGCHRLSEIASRLNKPAGSLTRPLSQLIELGYVRREVPFGESERSSKRTLYRLHDPFLDFYFRFVQPHRSLLELGRVEPVAAKVADELPGHVAGIWEELARQSVPFLGVADTEWGAASRWWSGSGPKFDVVAESLDGRSLLVGEVKWSEREVDPRRLVELLRAKMAGAPFVRGRRVIQALWLKQASGNTGEADALLTPEPVLAALI